MIGFRYHVVSTVAAFLALTVGIVLGTTVLQDPLLQRLTTDAAEQQERAQQLQDERDLARELTAGSGELLDAHAHDILAEHLAGVSVVLIEAPGADGAIRTELTERLEWAGGTVTGRISLTDTYVDPEESVFVDELTSQLAGGLELPERGTHLRAGTELAHALLDDPDSGVEPAGFDPRAVLDGFAHAGLLTMAGEPAAADIGVIIAADEENEDPEEPEDTEEPTDSAAALLDLGVALTEVGSSGAVVVGTPDTATEGLLQRVHVEESRITTVDVAGTPAGAVATTLAVASTVDGRVGRYGIGDEAEAFHPDPASDGNSDRAAE